MEKFWMIYCVKNVVQSFAPTKQHLTEMEAEKEAQRLARNNVGSQFVVLEAKNLYTVMFPEVTKIEML